MNLNNFTLHPSTWEQWVPTTLLEQYIYDSPYPMAVGYAEGPGWFILTKDPEERIAYCEQDAEPILFENPAHAEWGQVGRPSELPYLGGMVANSQLITAIFKFSPENTEIGETSIIQVRDRVFTYVRIYENLYRILSITQASPELRTS